MLDSDINKTGLRKGQTIDGLTPPPIPPVRSDETGKKNSSSKTSDVNTK